MHVTIHFKDRRDATSQKPRKNHCSYAMNRNPICHGYSAGRKEFYSYGVKIASDDLTFTCKNSLNFFLIKDIYLPILSKIDRDKKSNERLS